MLRGVAAATCAGVIVLGAAGCGGSSSGGGSSSPTSSSPAASGLQAICQRLASDAESLSTVVQQAGGSRQKLAEALRQHADQLKSDAANGPAGLQDGVNKLAQVLDAAADQIEHKKRPDLQAFQSKLQIAEGELDKACPHVTAPSTSPST